MYLFVCSILSILTTGYFIKNRWEAKFQEKSLTKKNEGFRLFVRRVKIQHERNALKLLFANPVLRISHLVSTKQKNKNL